MSNHSIEDILGPIENEAFLVQGAVGIALATGSIGSTHSDNNGNRYTVRRVVDRRGTAWRVTEATELTLLGMVFVSAGAEGRFRSHAA